MRASKVFSLASFRPTTFVDVFACCRSTAGLTSRFPICVALLVNNLVRTMVIQVLERLGVSFVMV